MTTPDNKRMRLDVYLNKVCLLKSRTMANEACDRGKVRVNEVPARPSREVYAGCEIELDLGEGPLRVEVVAVPAGNVSRVEAPSYYRVLRDDRGSKVFF